MNNENCYIIPAPTSSFRWVADVIKTSLLLILKISYTLSSKIIGHMTRVETKSWSVIFLRKSTMLDNLAFKIVMPN
jgi:hypothetical protein